MVGQNDELACVYAALILADDNIAITVKIYFIKIMFLIICKCYALFKSDKINAVLKAAGYEVEPYWPGIIFIK